MPVPFAVTAATNSVRLDEQHKGEAVYTVFNASGRAIRGRAQVVSDKPAAQAWLSIADGAERDFTIAAVQQFTVQINVPPNGPAGSYSFRIDMVGVDNPDEEYVQGPASTFVVAEPVPPHPFPWWILVVVVVGLVVIGGGTFFVIKQSQDQAKARAAATEQAAVAQTAIAQLANERLTSTALAQNQAATAAAQEAQLRTATVQAGQTQQAIQLAGAATQTAYVQQQSATQTAQSNEQATAQAAFQATAVAQATASFQAAINRYLGTWINKDSNSPVTKIGIGADVNKITVVVYAKYHDVMGNGGLAGATCGLFVQECALAQGTVTYSGDPLVVPAVSVPNRVVHQLTFSLVDTSLTLNGATLNVIDQTIVDGNKFGSPSAYAFSRPSNFKDIIIAPGLLENPGLFQLATPTP
jgi:hypothetical protein